MTRVAAGPCPQHTSVMPTALIAGATDGIGLATAHALARAGWTLHLHGRSADRLAAAASAIQGQGGAVAETWTADFANLAAVSSAGAAIADESIDAVVNCVGVFAPVPAVTKDGHDATWQINHLGGFLLVDLLLDRLVQRGGRVVQLTAALHAKGRFSDDGEPAASTDPTQVYATSKAAMIMASREVVRRLGPGSPVRLANLHPGVLETKLLAAFGFAGKGKPPEQAAEVIVGLLKADWPEMPNPGYVNVRRPADPSGPAATTGLDAAVYNVSCSHVAVPGLPGAT